MATLIQERFVISPALAVASADLAARLRAGTVEVRSQGHGNGSGVIWRPDGLIVTNHHVVHGDGAEVVLSDGRTFSARVIARHPARDLAALQIEASDLPALPIGDSSALRVGQLVVAMGHPLGLKGALTVGIVHALGGQARERGAAGLIRADLSLAPGNSGGPMADVQGRVLGINSMVAGGLALAIPSAAVSRFLGGANQPAFLGVEVQAVALPPALARQAEVRQEAALLTLGVVEGGPAASAGLQQGDILLSADAQALEDPEDLHSLLRDAGPEAPVALAILRGGVRREIRAVLGTHTQEAR